MKEISIRPSLPEDVEQAIELIYSSGPPEWEYIFKNETQDARQFIRKAFLKKGGRISHTVHRSLLLDDELVGIGAIAHDFQKLNMFFANGLAITNSYGFRAPFHMIRGLKAERIMPEPNRGESQINHIGISKKHRKMGLGTKIVKALITEITEAGNTPVLDVANDNFNAQALYKKLGFEIIKEYPSNLKNKYSYIRPSYRMKLNIHKYSA